MRNFISILSLFLCLSCTSVCSGVLVCPEHKKEINHIRCVASDSLVEAHRLTEDIIGSLVVTAEDMAWDAVKYSSTYTEFSETFRGGISHCNKKGAHIVPSNPNPIIKNKK
jgi:hypothetical protein